MKVISISNRAASTLRVILEPIADAFDVEPGQTAELAADFLEESETLEIEINSDTCVSIWTVGSVKVSLNGKDMFYPEL